MGRPELVLWSMKYQKDNLFLYSLVIKQHGSWSACPVFRLVDDISAIERKTILPQPVFNLWIGLCPTGGL